MSTGTAAARAAIAGNPSDGYRGAVLAVTIDGLQARVVARPASPVAIDPPSVLIEATARRLGIPAAIEWTSSIPRSVGLGGSSAIVIATVRALCGLRGVELEPAALASFALAVEVEDLGIAAGLQDRAAQAHGGLTFMEFRHPTPRYQGLDPHLLPPLLVAWLSDAAEHSGAVHGSLRERWDAGEPAVVESMAALAEHARAARRALLTGDRDAFAKSVDGSFDARQRMMALDPRHVELIAVARSGGASANYTGSGGAIVVVARDEPHREQLTVAFEELGCGTARPER